MLDAKPLSTDRDIIINQIIKVSTKITQNTNFVLKVKVQQFQTYMYNSFQNIAPSLHIIKKKA